MLPRVAVVFFVVVSVAAGLVYATAPNAAGPSVSARKSSTEEARDAAARPDIGRDLARLPPQVREMRDAVLAAARSGRIEDLLVPIQWNELKPDFADALVEDPIAHFKAVSGDGEGREILAVLAEILELPYAVLPLGRDIENNRMFVWPYVAALSPAALTPAEEVDMLRLTTPGALKAMKASNRYAGWQITIGADGTWHSFRRVE